MAGSSYFRGFLLEANTYNAQKVLSIKDDLGVAHPFIGGPATNTIQHNGQSQLPYSFTSPFVAHLVREEPQDSIAWKKFGSIQWLADPWPEFDDSSSAWINCGTPGAKYMQALIVPVDTGGLPAYILVKSADGGTATLGPVTTAAGVKTVVALPFTVPFVVHEIQIRKNGTCRIWYDEAKWEFDPWPEFITEASAWRDFGTRKNKYMRGIFIPMDTGGQTVHVPFTSSEGTTVTLTANTPALQKTPVPFSFLIPFIGREFQTGNPDGDVRIWFNEIVADFDEWPEIISEATGWLPILGGANAFLQGLVVPLEANGATPSIRLLTDTGQNVALTSIVTPVAGVKTSMPFSLTSPIIAHQVQLVPSSPCRLWLNEIIWISQPTPERAATWSTQLTSHGLKGFQSIFRMDVSYESSSDVTFSVFCFDGTSPATVTLPSTGGVQQKAQIVLSPNKGQLFQYSAVSPHPFRVFLPDWTIWICEYGRSGPAAPWKFIGGARGEGAAI